MLILTRKIGESVQIGSNVSVKVISIDGGQVRLGFEAPDSVTIYREEIATKIKKQNEMASISFNLDAITPLTIKRKQ